MAFGGAVVDGVRAPKLEPAPVPAPALRVCCVEDVWLELEWPPIAALPSAPPAPAPPLGGRRDEPEVKSLGAPEPEPIPEPIPEPLGP